MSGRPRRFDSVKEMCAFLSRTKRLTDKDVWDVLTALRGPDSRDKGLKAMTTEAIRGSLLKNYACPVACRDPYAYWYPYPPGDEARKASSTEAAHALGKDDKEQHFKEHVQAALRALEKVGRLKPGPR